VSVLEAGSAVPEFSLKTVEGETFGPSDLEGRITVLVFYPFAFSAVCTDQFNIYEEVLAEIKARGAQIYGVSCDSPYSQTAFIEKLGGTIPQLSDFEPKGASCEAFGVLHPGGFPQRALVVVGPDGKIAWSHQAENPGVLPGANLIFDGLDAAGAVA
jgi:peroxiredoxin (alkyl hydroperoxide reductase subunit C)